MKLNIRRTYSFIETKNESAGRAVSVPVRKAAVAVVIENPYAGKGYVHDLGELIDAGVTLGEVLAELAMEAFGPYEIQAYGKGGIVGTDGEQEHANALLTTPAAVPIRKAVGGGDAWISSMTKVAVPGALIDVPMNHKDDVYVRSHYDGMSLMFPGTPMPDEIAVIYVFASHSRVHARVGGLTHEEVVARKRSKLQAS